MRIVFIGFFVLLPCLFFAQGIQQTFGKNRVQYHNFFDEWSQYESDNFLIYWYGRSRNIGQFVVQAAEYDFSRIQSVLEHRMNEKIQIIVYADLTDLKQSNLGSEEAFTNTGGQTKIAGNTVFLYFDGDHTHLRRDIREGVASVYLEAMLFGGNIQEIVQNAVLLNLPAWFQIGLAEYVGTPWSSELDNELRDAFLSEDFRGFERLAEDQPRISGHAFWYYIAEHYGRSTVSNLLYLTRINRSIESGFLYVLGNSYPTVIAEMEAYFRLRYQAEQAATEPPGQALEIKNKRALPITQLKISPDGTRMVYVLNEIGRYKVYLHDFTKDKTSVIFKKGFRNSFQATDYNYPLISWRPDGQSLAILYETNDNINLLLIDVLKGKKEEEIPMPDQYQRIYSLEFLDPFTMVLTGAVSGFSDVYLFYPKTRQSRQVTNDFYDDLDAVPVNVRNRKGILFSSNRQDSLIRPMRMDTILPINTFDIFYYNLEEEDPELVRVTNTPLANERGPIAIDTTWMGWLTDQSGIYNQQIGRLEEYVAFYEVVTILENGTEIVMHADSVLESLDSLDVDTMYTRPVIKERSVNKRISNVDRNLLSQDYSPVLRETFSAVFRKETYDIYRRPLTTDSIIRPVQTGFNKSSGKLLGGKQDVLNEFTSSDEEGSGKAKPQAKDPLQKGQDQFFQSEFGNPSARIRPSTPTSPEEEETIIEESVRILPPGPALRLRPELEEEAEAYKYNPLRLTPYRLQFRIDVITSQLDNSLLFDGLNNFAAMPDNLGFPPPGILLKANVKDLLEDYEFEGGVRIPTTFNGTEYFFIYRDKKRRLDKEYAIYLRNQRFSEDGPGFTPLRREANVLLGQFGVRYPFNIFNALTARLTLRRDRLQLQATDINSFNEPVDLQSRIGLRTEYIFDNTLDMALNLKIGTRAKIYAEGMKGFNIGQGEGLSFSNGFLWNVGVDARRYERLLKYSVFAARFAAATSFGEDRILYNLGGVDNWLFPETGEPIPLEGQNYVYQTLAAHMRGFPLNIRNGNSYALINSELRVPIFRYISKRISSPFLRNFQLVGFFDVGTAWEGSSPYDDDNPLNSNVVQDGGIVKVTVDSFRDPLVAGYGFGARTMLFGYFVRVDYAWGIETREVLDPRLYFSIGLDF